MDSPIASSRLMRAIHGYCFSDEDLPIKPWTSLQDLVE